MLVVLCSVGSAAFLAWVSWRLRQAAKTIDAILVEREPESPNGTG